MLALTPRAAAPQPSPRSSGAPSTVSFTASFAPSFAATVAAVLATSLQLWAPAAQAASVLIDDFSAPSPAFSATVTGTNTVLQRDFTATVPGGVREVVYNLYSNAQGGSVGLSVGDGSVAVSAGKDALGELLFSYGGFTRPTGDVNVGGPNLGWDLSGYNAIELDFGAVDQVLNINYTLYTAAPGSGLFYNSAGVNAAPGTPGGPLTVLIPFSGTAFNFNQVDGVFFEIDRSGSARGNRYVLNSAHFVTMPVPEPQTAFLCLTGLAALAGMGHRHGRRRSA